MKPRIVLAGRPNVGKSTLFNRLYGEKKALVSDIPGLTRDYREGSVVIEKDLEVDLIDTAGVFEGTEGPLSKMIQGNAIEVISSSDLCLFIVDGKSGLTQSDNDIAKFLRKSGLFTIIIVNKCETGLSKKNIYEFFELGFGEPITISAEHNMGIKNLLSKIKEYLPEKGQSYEDREDSIKMAIVGKPNVGKSTLVNKLFGEDRMLTGDIAGITRDSIDMDWEWNNQSFTLIDTAGLRRKSRVQEDTEKLANFSSMKSIKYADIVVLLLDATNFIDKQDLRLADFIIKEGRALLIVFNKYDLIPDKHEFDNNINNFITTNLPQINNSSIIKISSLGGYGIQKMMKQSIDIYREWTNRVPTSKLNGWLYEAVQKHQPPAKSGRRVKLRYITQSSIKPPTFVVFSSAPANIPASYRKYLINEIRSTFGFNITPIRLHFRKGENPYIK